MIHLDNEPENIISAHVIELFYKKFCSFCFLGSKY